MGCATRAVVDAHTCNVLEKLRCNAFFDVQFVCSIKRAVLYENPGFRVDNAQCYVS